MGTRKLIDVEAVREMAGRGMMDGEIATAFRCDIKTVYRFRRRHGIPCGIGGTQPERMRRKRAQSLVAFYAAKREEYRNDVLSMVGVGCHDWEVAERLGIGTELIARIRREGGVGPAKYSPAARREMAERMRVLQQRAVEIAAERQTAIAASRGLPPGLTPREVDVLICLLDGPQTVPQLRSRLGLPPGVKHVGSAVGRGSYLRELCEFGLVVRVDCHGQKSSYLLTMKALDMLSNAGAQP